MMRQARARARVVERERAAFWQAHERVMVEITRPLRAAARAARFRARVEECSRSPYPGPVLSDPVAEWARLRR